MEKNKYELTIIPENTPINDSPWFAFKIQRLNNQVQSINIELKFIGGPSRYQPKISTDGKEWQELKHADEENKTTFSVQLTQETLWIAAQELITETNYQDWFEKHQSNQSIKLEVIGKSNQGRPINMLRVNPNSKDVVVILGRQHPPEVTGALALFPFVDTILEDTLLAQQFRQRFQILVIPNLNPDGVSLGNWRHNANGVDTNRDWGQFAQPETKAVATLLSELEKRGAQFYLGLDFHSTNRNVFYTQEDSDPLCPADFSGNWVKAVQSALPNYEVKRSARTSDGNPTFKQWFNTTYKVPSISFELDDDVDRAQILPVAKTSANQMMRLLLQSSCPKK